MRRTLLFALVAATGCATAEPIADLVPAEKIPVRGEVPGYVCRELPDRNFVGQVATSELGARMLAESRAQTLRWVPHGAMITMEFSPSRLTVRLDAQNRILSISCG